MSTVSKEENSSLNQCSKKPCYDFNVSSEWCELCQGELFHPSIKHTNLSEEANLPNYEWLSPNTNSKTTKKKKKK